MLSIVGGGIQRLSATVYIAVSFFPLPLCFFFFFFISLCETCIGGFEIRVSLDFREISCSSLAAVMQKNFFFFFLDRLNSTLRKASAGCWNVVVV